MSWESWCERGIAVGKVTVGTKCGIFCRKEGGKWGSVPADFNVPAPVLKSIEGGVNGENRDPVTIDGNKYQYVRQMEIENLKYAIYKCGATGMTCALTNSAVIVGFYDAGVQGGANANAIYNLMVALKTAYQEIS